MSQELDVRIAKCRGWRFPQEPTLQNEWRFCEETLPNGDIALRPEIPKWSSSLDLMHELEGELDLNEKLEYTEELERGRVYFNDIEVGITQGEKFDLIHATAEQKAQAWLKVKEGV